MHTITKATLSMLTMGFCSALLGCSDAPKGPDDLGTTPPAPIVGHWQAKDAQGNPVKLSFGTDNKVTLDANGMARADATYKLDSGKLISQFVDAADQKQHRQTAAYYISKDNKTLAYPAWVAMPAGDGKSVVGVWDKTIIDETLDDGGKATATSTIDTSLTFTADNKVSRVSTKDGTADPAVDGTYKDADGMPGWIALTLPVTGSPDPMTIVIEALDFAALTSQPFDRQPAP